MSHLTPSMREFLSAPHFAVAATIDADGLPHQTVVWYLLDGEDELIINTPEGSMKHKHVLRDPRLSLCVEEGFRYVTLSGTVSVVEDPGRAMYGRLGQHYQASTAARPAAPPATMSPKTMEMLARERVTLRLKIDKVLAMGIG